MPIAIQIIYPVGNNRGPQSLILADEPTGNVDYENSKKILSLFSEMNKLGTTIIIATHDESLISHKRASIINIENNGIRIRSK